MVKHGNGSMLRGFSFFSKENHININKKVDEAKYNPEHKPLKGCKPPECQKYVNLLAR